MKKLKPFLAAKGILYFLTRFGGSVIRRSAFDQCYKSGSWDHLDKGHSQEMVKVVEKYANKGRILDMGCGTGIIVSMLTPDSFEYYLGVDASKEAIALAQKRRSVKIDFDVSDIQSYKCRGKFNLIVFEESLYYVPFFRRRLLMRFAKSLSPKGLFIVTVADPARFAGMIRMIRKYFHVIEDRNFHQSHRFLLVFSLRPQI